MLSDINCLSSSLSLTIEDLADKMDKASANSPSCSLVILPSFSAAAAAAGSVNYKQPSGVHVSRKSSPCI
jgi:hypothetical protein